MNTTQITFRELLQDSSYRAWFKRQPRRGLDQPWRVWVQVNEGDRWRKRDFKTHKKAYRFVLMYYKRFHDLALSCPSRQFAPPILVVGHEPKFMVKDGKRVKVQVPIKEYWSVHHTPLEHAWCGICRRPTIFGYFRRHHAMPARTVTPYKLRCTICGCAQSFQRYR